MLSAVRRRVLPLIWAAVLIRSVREMRDGDIEAAAASILVVAFILAGDAVVEILASWMDARE